MLGDPRIEDEGERYDAPLEGSKRENGGEHIPPLFKHLFPTTGTPSDPFRATSNEHRP